VPGFSASGPAHVERELSDTVIFFAYCAKLTTGRMVRLERSAEREGRCRTGPRGKSFGLAANSDQLASIPTDRRMGA